MHGKHRCDHSAVTVLPFIFLTEKKNIMVKNTRRQYLQLCQLYDGFCNFLMFLYCLLFRTCFRIVLLNDNFILAIDHRFDFCKYIFPASNLFLDVFGVAKVACLRKSSLWSVVIIAGCVVFQWVCRAAEGQYDFTLTTFVASSGLAFCNSEILVLEFARVDVGKHVGDKV